MRPLSYALSIAALSASLLGGPAQALDLPPICKALHGLADAARSSGQPQRISAAVDLAGAGDCRPVTDGPATRAFCDAAGQAGGLAWRLYDCENTLASGAHVTTRDEHAEHRFRKAITRLTASLGHGVRLDLSEAGGRYDIVVWSPK